MQLEMRGKHLDVTEALRTHATRRLQFALGRFGQHIARVTVHLTDLNGPRGGRDKHCRIVVKMTHRGKIIVEDVDTDVRTAITQAAERLSRTVAREVARRREHSVYPIVASPQQEAAGIPHAGVQPQRAGMKPREKQ